MAKTKPHGLFFKDNFFSKLFTIRQQSPPESAYANSLKGMRIHRDGSLAHAIGESPLALWRRSNGVYDHEHGSSLKG